MMARTSLGPDAEADPVDRAELAVVHSEVVDFEQRRALIVAPESLTTTPLSLMMRPPR